MLALAGWASRAEWPRAAIREQGLDVLLPLLLAKPSAPTGPELVIVDIDRESLARLGPWPWPRERLARLVDAVTAVEPVAVGLDMVLAEADRLSPAALARALAAETRRDDLLALADTLPDADRLLASAMEQAPVALGFVLDPDLTGHRAIRPAAPILLRGDIPVPDIWRAPGMVGPQPALALAARGLGTVSLTADSDGPVRRVPLLVLAGGSPYPGLAVEIARLAQDASALILEPDGRMRLGAREIGFGPDAALRLLPGAWRGRRLAAADVMGGAAGQLRGRIMLIGSSAPELGGLRPGHDGMLTPSVDIQAAAVTALLHGPVLRRPGWVAAWEPAAAVALGLLGLVLAARMRPLPAIAGMLALTSAWVAVAGISARGWGVLVDPAGPAVIAGLGFAVALAARFAREEWLARRLRARFEQHLAPEVVRRIAAAPEALRLAGEQRELTAFFSDIEGFTAMTERAEPTELVALLDQYFDMASEAITAEGGMVDKIVGDAVTAIFNAPLDLPEHASRALAAARAMQAGAEALRASPLGRRLGLGRTRIGIETGIAVVGDIGGARKLDYTAIGGVMNTAARLEGANKEFATSVCIGPGTAAQVDQAQLRPVGTFTPRGQARAVTVYTLA